MKKTTLLLILFAFILNANSIDAQRAKLDVKDISWPSIVNLNIGDVDEFVYRIKNVGYIGSKIDTIVFYYTQNANISYFPSASPIFFLTHHDSVISNTETKYFYNNYIGYPTHPLSAGNIIIDTVMLKHATGKGYLAPGDSVILHIPYSVTSCGSNITGNNTFFLDSVHHYRDTVVENNSVSAEPGSPLLAGIDTIIDSGSFCSTLPKHFYNFRFNYRNNGTRFIGYYPGNAQADSLRIYLYTNIGLGTIDTATIKINGVHIVKRYITTYTSSPYNVYVVDLTNYPAGINGHPFGYNTICDMNGSNFADGLGEDSTFNITGVYKFDSTSCPPYVQNASPAVPNNFVLPAIGTECTNMCYTVIYDSLHKLPSADLPSYQPWAGGAAYTYQSSTSIMTSASAPSDVTNSSPDFNFTICPYFFQQWASYPYNFDCPKQDWTIVSPLTKGVSIKHLPQLLSCQYSLFTPHLTQTFTTSPMVNG